MNSRYRPWFYRGVAYLLMLWIIPLRSQGQLVLSNQYYEVAALTDSMIEMYGRSELHITGSDTPVSNSSINLNSINAWVFLDEVQPSLVSALLPQFTVNGSAAQSGVNVRIVQHGQGAILIPTPSDFRPLEVFDGENFSGESFGLSPNTTYGAVLGSGSSSFILKRGYMATFARNANGTGYSVNYVASAGDLEIGSLPPELNNHAAFIRVYPWHWVAKKGSCDIAPGELDAQWHYNWNVTWQAAQPDYEYVAIKQQPNWPGLPSPADAGYLGVNHVSGFNEPDNSVEDAYNNLSPPGSVSDAVARQSELLGTGLRVGAPAVTDGGYQWIVDFMNQAEAAGHRIDYVPIHYYRSYSNNDYPAGAANNLYTFLKGIYDATHKPIWLTEFNNGANWTGDADPTFDQNRNVIEAMISMMDDLPWLERYSVYSAVEEVRQVYYNGGGYTPMGLMYKDHASPVGYQQIIPGEGMAASASYHFENDLADASGSGNHALSRNFPDYGSGHDGGASLQFDGVNDHVILPDSLSDGADFTFAAWIYWNGGAAWQRIFDFGILDSDTYMFLTPSNGSALRFAITTGGWGGEQQLTAPTALPINTWSHVAVTVSGNTGRLYVNGSQVAVNTSMTLNPADLGAIQHYLGRSQFPADPYFSGRIDEVVIRDEALSGTQIAALMTNRPPQVSTNSVDGGTAYEGTSYAGSVAGNATDPDGGEITYSKVYGPDWLVVDPDGTLSGTPSGNLPPAQYVTIRAADAANAVSYFILNLDYVDIPEDYTSGPVAYWDFNDPALGAANGAALPDSDAYTVWREAAADKSGNGNHLTTWDYAFAGFNWSSSSADGDYSIVAAGDYPAAYTWSGQSAPAGIDAESAVLSNFTVEARFTITGSGNRTVLGRDALGVSDSAPNNAALYLGVDGSNHPVIEFTDENGGRVRLIASSTTLANDDTTWYHMAAVYNGSILSLYLNETLIASTAAGPGALAIGLGNGTDWHTGGWSVGRGLWSGGHTDRWYGHIDGVAISGVALSPGRFVITGTWPTGYEFYVDGYGIPGAAFDGDANSNGVPNGMEYYLGWNPTDGVTTNDVLTFTSNYLSVVHPYNTAATGVNGAVEWTSDLLSSNWFTSGITYLTNEPTGEIEALLGATTTTQLFLRLNVAE